MPDEPAKQPNRSHPLNKPLGNTGEQIVAARLERLGWRVLATQFRCAQGEIDVIAEEPAQDGKVLVFVEVKTRRGSAHGTPLEAVNARKQARLIAAAQAYLAQRDAEGEEPACRFDVAEVFMGPEGLARVRLHRAAFGQQG
ncbi:MAG TPA: YraN family protein [Chthonomonadaceae bacterium]|nr:YraN family protein [Chthonomonadaceae bacterium]